MDPIEKNIDTYAELAVKVGINLQKGQTLVIFASISAAQFVRKISRIAYKNGAHTVHVEWGDEKLQRLEYELASENALIDVPMWVVKGYEEFVKQNAAFLYVVSPHLDNMDGIDPERIELAANAATSAFRSFSESLTSMQVSWLVLTFPTEQ